MLFKKGPLLPLYNISGKYRDQFTGLIEKTYPPTRVRVLW